ncbi:hypothetical protein F4809DRAFT_605846 [Biscogniauxia mediterranea]|nr:hypothetical protein F4809DRAFT_605846 [Biscogniauxia mediterranea]
MDKKKKLVFQLDTPYSAVSWPEISLHDQETILELLCTFLAPLGHYRSKYIQPSKGKRAKKRKHTESSDQAAVLQPPPRPELSSYVDVGLSAVTRCLQNAASQGRDLKSSVELDDTSEKDRLARLYSVIFVARSGQPSILNNHLPQMVAVASKAHPSRTPIRLVGLSKACQDRLSESVGIPRVSYIGLYEDAPNSKPLVDFVRQHVPAIEATWLEEASRAEYRETNINVIETFIGSKKQRTKG